MPPEKFLPPTAVAKLLKLFHKDLKPLFGDHTDFLGPDVQIGDRIGWDPERIHAWGVDQGLLTTEGEHTSTKRTWSKPIHKKWCVETRVYLSREEFARLLHLSPATVYMNHWRHQRGEKDFPDPAIKIGMIVGWDPETAHRYAEQRAGRN